ncbi:hypothetical protein VNO80_06059 [Phaseolus coccineus]|uniref:Uncharacterized protein n=1 Tax=Phaseolus coccineus TaxID=3886 RepID=A0AAN9NH22_PHACN
MVLMAEWSKAPDSSSGLRKRAWVQIPLLTILFLFTFSRVVRHYKFDVESMIQKPDCIEHIVMGLNGQFPGPTMLVTSFILLSPITFSYREQSMELDR